MLSNVSLKLTSAFLSTCILCGCLDSLNSSDTQFNNMVEELEEAFAWTCEFKYEFEIGTPEYNYCVDLERKVFYGEVEASYQLSRLQRKIKEQEDQNRRLRRQREDEQLRRSLCPLNSTRVGC